MHLDSEFESCRAGAYRKPSTAVQALDFHFHCGWLSYLSLREKSASMAIDVIHTKPEPRAQARANGETTPRVVDVSGLPAARVEAFAAGADVHLERRAGRTYLVHTD